jgi:stage V sporulation protein D (sporulation-specific penicillin-binding protein)
MVRNLSLVFIVLSILLVGLIFTVYRQVKANGEKYQKKALSQQTYVSSSIPYKRGEIQDRNGTVFARSETVYDLIISPKDILQTDTDGNQIYLQAAINALEQYFGVEKETVEKILSEKSGSQYVRLEQDMDAELVENYKAAREEEEKAVKARNAKKGKDEEEETFIDLDNCIYFEMNYKRVYPLESTASNVIGFATDNTTLGVENYYNDQLTGTAGRNYGYFNSDGELERIVKPAENGNTVITTLDANVQQIVEKHIKKFLNGKIGAERVSVVLSNPQNGEIYAMASTNPYDLNNPYDLSAYYSEDEIEKMTETERVDALSDMWHNYCISDTYEPGSTFKPFTVSAVLEENSATDKTTYVCDGYQMISGWPKPIKCTHVHGTITMAQTIMFSCNDALMQMAAKLGADNFYRYEKSFGLGQKTGVDLPGEGAGIILSRDQLTAVDLAASSFGQSNTVTMMQMIAGFSSIINGGNYYVPHVMKKIVDSNGAVVENYPDEVVRKTISEKTSKLLKKYLLRTVSDDSSTATGARVKGYEIGGKTGTAEKQPRGKGNYLLSFIGYVGYDEPELVIYVIIDEPHVEDQAHSGFATEFASKILKDVLPFLGIYKESGTGSKTTTKKDTAVEEQTSSGETTEETSEGNSEEASGDEDTQDGEDAISEDELFGEEESDNGLPDIETGTSEGSDDSSEEAGTGEDETEEETEEDTGEDTGEDTEEGEGGEESGTE